MVPEVLFVGEERGVTRRFPEILLCLLNALWRSPLRSAATLLILFTASAVLAQAPARATLRGQVTDQSGGAVPGATVTVASVRGRVPAGRTDSYGNYRVTDLLPGRYTVSVDYPGFAPFQSAKIDLAAGSIREANVRLILENNRSEVTVNSETQTLSLEPTENANALVLSGADLDALPDDPDDLLTDLKALAGPGAGAGGSQLFLDGFSGGRLPPKDSIREVRINQDPFSAEYDKLGYGRIEVFTKPGSEAVHGSLSYRISDAATNTRNPLLSIKPPYRAQQMDGDAEGPLGKHMSWFIDFERRNIQDNAVVAATILDPSFHVTPLSQAVLAPYTSTSISPRLDWQVDNRNTLTFRYSWLQSADQKSGVGQFVLPSAGYGLQEAHHTGQITETFVLGPQTVVETGFQFNRDSNVYQPYTSLPSLKVLDAFTGGGPQIGPSLNNENEYELHNYTSIVHGANTVKFGGQLRTVRLNDTSYRDFGGTYIFSGGTAPELNAQNQPVLGPDGQPIQISVTSLERYRRTLAFQAAGLTAPEIRALGGGPSQFTLAAGAPFLGINQTDGSIFLQDDWRVRPNLSLSAGLRYEVQTNISDFHDIAPRLGFAWAPGGHKAKTVIRSGAGFFYDRFPINLVLEAMRFNGITQQQFIVRHPGFYPAIPPVSGLPGLASSQILRQLQPNLQAPLLFQTAISVERQLGFKTVVSATFLGSRGVHLLRSRDVNAPIPGTYPAGQPQLGIRPFGPNDIYQYESAGVLNQRQILVNITRRLSGGFSLFGYYAYMHALSNTDGAIWFVSNPYNANADYGRSALDVAHSVVVGATYLGPLRLSFSPFLVARSGAPFDITTGQDPYGTLVYNARPSVAANAQQPGALATPFGIFQTNPAPAASLIPHNYGQGPAFVTLNLRVSRTFGFGGEGGVPSVKKKDKSSKKGSGGAPGMAVERPDTNAAESMVHDASTQQRYTIVAAVIVRNSFNHFNPGLPIGDLSSPLLGQSNWLASPSGPLSPMYGDNRRIFFQIKFRF